MPGCQVDESVREIKRGPGDLAPALVLPCYDCATGSPLHDGERDHVPTPGKSGLDLCEQCQHLGVARQVQPRGERTGERPDCGAHDRAPAATRFGPGLPDVSSIRPLNSIVKTLG